MVSRTNYDLARSPVTIEQWRSMPGYENATMVEEVDAGTMNSAAFERDFRRPLRPLVIRGALAGSVPVERWSSSDYLVEQVGEDEVPVRRFHYTDFIASLWKSGKVLKWEQELEKLLEPTPFEAYVEELTRENDTQVYVSEVPVPDGLAEDIDSVEYLFPEIKRRRREPRSMFIGGRTYSSLHFHGAVDAFLNQLVGRKEVVLFPPDERHKRALYSSFWYQNFSRVHLFDVDLDEFPNFRDAQPFRCELGPGDSLYIPNPWWHAVMGLDGLNVSVTDWFDPIRVTFEAPPTRFHAMLVPTLYFGSDRGEIEVPSIGSFIRNLVRGRSASSSDPFQVQSLLTTST